ncbi:hypothetical protein [Solirubrobacter soli]|uniref:hypothetical protein n=1 Tax=Solirubrobacter soli TaxID=363832 RepID=UPI0004869A45|nr:hypothetical protein [Solirubrobacter soli]
MLTTVAVLAANVAGGFDAGAATAAVRLDSGTASVLADDIGFDHFCDADCDVSLHRCYRVDSLRVDCIMSLDTGGDDWRYFVIATALVGDVLQFGDYSISGHPRITRSLIRRWPPGFHTRRIAEWYAHSPWTKSGFKIFYPNRLLRKHVGYGRPHLRSVIRAQCHLQPRLHCSWR